MEEKTPDNISPLFEKIIHRKRDSFMIPSILMSIAAGIIVTKEN